MKSLVLLVVIALLPCLAFAEDEKPPVINWSALDVAGKEVKVPADKPTVLLFVRGEHAPSAVAIEQIAKLGADKTAQVIVILSGKQAAEQAKAMQVGGWPIVVDPDYAASGKMNIHVWPTTLVVKGDGQQVAHVAGMPKSYAADVEAYLAFAGGTLDEAGLKQKLSTRETVSDSPREKAGRHMQIAQQLLSRGKATQAKAEVDEAMKLMPEDPAVQLLSARVLVETGQAAEAIAVLDKMNGAATGPAWRTKVVRARALIALDKWADAKAILPDAIKLNPDPAEAQYLLGLTHQHDNDWPNAAEAFRKAYEAAQGKP